MTVHLLDVASYQGALRPADVRLAGFTGVNLKVSHGLSRKSVHPNVTGWVEAAPAYRLSVSTFHYMTGDAPGEDQAEYAFDRIRELGLEYGTAHQCDVESSPPPTLAMVRGYLTRMTELLRRPVALYTGDWWWAVRPGWRVDDLTPYLWSAPNTGYLSAYPGDTGAVWTAGYGGWPRLSIMQYAVGPLRFPDGSRGSIDVSKSAIRDGAVWRDLTLGRPGMSIAPNTLKAARTFYIDTLRGLGYNIDPLSVGIVGDDSHANSGTSYHLGKDALKSTAYSIVESSRDRNGLSNAAAAVDYGWFSLKVGGVTHNLRTFSAWLVAECRSGAADTLDIREIIYSLDGETVKRWDRLGKRTTGDSSHTSHTHVSYFRDSEDRDKTALLRRYFAEITQEETMALTTAEMDDIADRVWAKALGTSGSAGGQIQTLFARSTELRTALIPALATAIGQVLTNVQADDGDKAALLDAIAVSQAQTAEAAAAAVRDAFGSDDADPNDIADALVAALGAQRAAAVGAILAA